MTTGVNRASKSTNTFLLPLSNVNINDVDRVGGKAAAIASKRMMIS